MATMRAFLVVLIVALAGCPKSKPAEPPGGDDGDDSSEVVDEKYACSSDADCVPVETECCDHCNGGSLVAANKDHADAVRAESAPPGSCDGVGCTKMACVDDPMVTCSDGTCAIVEGM
jgi:hypothetical protein